MALLTIEQCRTQCRIDGVYADADLESLLASSVDAATAYLNRSVYEDQVAMDAALTALPNEAATAQANYDAAVIVAEAETDSAKAAAMMSIARMNLSASQRAAVWAVNGIVANPSITAAVRLTLGHLYANRESVVLGAQVSELPLGVTSLLRPYRRVMMP